jgi:hypothetical protein
VNTLKLEFNDDHETIIYLNAGAIRQIRLNRFTHTRSSDTDIHYLSIKIDNSDYDHVLVYETKQDRDVDYEYAIKQLDILMNVNREEF